MQIIAVRFLGLKYTMCTLFSKFQTTQNAFLGMHVFKMEIAVASVLFSYAYLHTIVHFKYHLLILKDLHLIQRISAGTENQ